MKHVLFLLLAFITIPTWGTANEDKKETYPTEIEIMGTFEDHKDRSLVLPLEAYLDGSQLTLTFFDTIKDVTISIVGNSGTVEARTVSFTNFQTETFDVSRYAVGSYSLLITTPRGTYLSGNFKIGI
ncbi:DUF3244 domain-containing protein [Phocaeicola faecalis]